MHVKDLDVEDEETARNEASSRGNSLFVHLSSDLKMRWDLQTLTLGKLLSCKGPIEIRGMYSTCSLYNARLLKLFILFIPGSLVFFGGETEQQHLLSSALTSRRCLGNSTTFA